MNKEFLNIYINENLLQLIETNDVPFIILKDNQKLVEYSDDTSILNDAIVNLERNEMNRIVLHSESLANLKSDVFALFEVIVAAGGIVKNEKEEILSIFRRGKWDFPKGKIEENEKKKDCAIREVKEECGLKNVEIVKKLGSTFHSYGNPKARKLKESIWYIMTSKDKKLVPQKEEDIEIAKWFKYDEFLLQAKPIFPNIKDVYEYFLIKNQ